MKLRQKEPSFFINSELTLTAIERWLIGHSERMGNLNQNMFREDFDNIFVGSSRRSTATFKIVSSNPDLQQELLDSFVARRGYSRGVSVIEEIVDEVTQSLLHHDKAVYCLFEGESGERFFRLIPSNTIFRFAGLAFQYVPKRLERHWESDGTHLGREIRILPKRRLLFFDWPKAIRRKIRAQNRTLKVLDKYAHEGGIKHMPRPTHENPNPKNYFDFSVWREARDYALFNATRLTGWSGRQSSNPRRSDFFICHRLIRFRKLQVELASHILNSLSRQLSAFGQQQERGFEIQISLNEVYQSISQLEELESRLEKEEVSFREVRDYCYWR